MFCEHLRDLGEHRLAAEELNRVQFRCEKTRISVHFVKDYPYSNRTVSAIQVLFRLGSPGFKERAYFLGLRPQNSYTDTSCDWSECPTWVMNRPSPHGSGASGM